jgi:hypothetical protein
MGIYCTESESGRYENLDPDPDQKPSGSAIRCAQHFTNFTLILKKVNGLKVVDCKTFKTVNIR